jgi:hypothetical protein
MVRHEAIEIIWSSYSVGSRRLSMPHFPSLFLQGDGKQEGMIPHASFVGLQQAKSNGLECMTRMGCVVTLPSQITILDLLHQERPRLVGSCFANRLVIMGAMRQMGPPSFPNLKGGLHFMKAELVLSPIDGLQLASYSVGTEGMALARMAMGIRVSILTFYAFFWFANGWYLNFGKFENKNANVQKKTKTS